MTPSQPLPVLFMIQFLDSGGTEHHFEELISHLDRRVVEPHVIYYHPGVVSRRLEALGNLKIQRLLVRRAYDWSGLKAVAAVRRYIREHRIGALVTYHFSADFIGTLAARWAGRVPVISSRRDMGFTRTRRQLQIGHWLDRWVGGYVAVSDAVRQAIARDEAVVPAKIQVIYNGIDLAELDSQRWDLAAERGRLGLGEGDCVIACIANFNPVKDHATLLEAFAHMRQQPDVGAVKLLLVGDGPERQNIETTTQRLGLGGEVVLAGRSQAVTRELQLADVVILPSITEGFSNTILQAMAYRKPVVACAVGGNPEAIENGKTGLLVEARDVQAMASALERLVRERPLRQAMGDAGRERVQRLFTRGKMIADTQEMILGLARK